MIRPQESTARLASPRAAALALAALLVAAMLFGVLAGGDLAQATPAPTADGPAQPNTPKPKVSGNKLIDTRTGKIWVPRGASVPSLAYACVQGWTPDVYFSLEGAKAMASWGMDVVRFPLNQDCWLGTDGAPEQPGSGTAAEYRERVKRWVDWSHQAGLAVILDLHWSAAPGYRAEDQQAMTDSQSVTFWEQVAAVYAGDPSVMFELFNEPYNWPNPSLDWQCWRDGGCELSVKNQSEWPQPEDPTFTVSGMQDLVDAVRGTGAKQPVIVNGLNYANDLPAWLRYRPTDPAACAGSRPRRSAHMIAVYERLFAETSVKGERFGARNDFGCAIRYSDQA
ncbi:MAG: cellulase family glycosylhydrolase, partial [Actinobacteria bacterium]|nr:cellulase family glycosylhydrolase [Actinomycetota bacterium]